jgi:hypothetical protein
MMMHHWVEGKLVRKDIIIFMMFIIFLTYIMHLLHCRWSNARQITEVVTHVLVHLRYQFDRMGPDEV